MHTNRRIPELRIRSSGTAIFRRRRISRYLPCCAFVFEVGTSPRVASIMMILARVNGIHTGRFLSLPL